MTIAFVKHVDQWGECIDRPEENCVEIRWYDTTKNMSGEDFNQFLAQFASVIEKSQCNNALVDAVQFKMDMSKMSMGWRDEHIIPRYNAAGIKKFAFIMPSGMPAIGSEPHIEGPANFPTGYFGSRQNAFSWFNND